MNPEHSQHCHCVCSDLYELQAAIEEARAIHLEPEPKHNCIMCGNNAGLCDACQWTKNCVVCNEVWPCDTFIALDLERS